MARKRHHSSHKKSHGHMMEHAMGSKSGHQGAQYHHNSPYPGGSEEAKERRDYGISERGSQASYRRGKMMGGFYEGPEPRRKIEKMDGSMIHEDHNAIANLPQNVMIKAYPDRMNYLPEDLDDTIHGVDRQIDYDDSKRTDNFYPKKV